MLFPSLVLSLVPLLAPPVPGNVHRVGPTRTHVTIDSAVAAAVTGDIILVDPGTYPPFSVDGKGISIVPEGLFFTVLESASGTPAILVENVAAPAEVTIVSVRIDHGPAQDAPAVHVRNNTGAVKLSDVLVTQVDDLFGTVQKGAIQVESTKTLWLQDTKVRSLTRAYAAFRQGVSEWEEAVSGLYLDDTNAIVKGCRLLGYDAGLDYAGDGIRVEGNSTAWLIDNLVGSPQRSSYEGGDGSYGGSAVQAFGKPWNEARITTCGAVEFVSGKGSTQPGGFYSINGDASLIPGPFPAKRRPDGCLIDAVSEVTVDPARAPIGSSFKVRIMSVKKQTYFCVASLEADYTRVLRGLRGRGVVPIDPSVTFTLAQGSLPEGQPVPIDVTVPNLLSLAGTQIAFQAITASVKWGFGFWSLSFPSFVVITP